MTKKTDRSKLNAKLDKLAKDVAKARDGNICQKCGKWVEGSNRQGSHVIPVSAGNKLRWNPQNIKVLCHHCHLNWWHKNPMEAAAWFETTFPERWEYIQANRGTQKFTVDELRQLEKELKEQLKELENANSSGTN